MRMYLYISLFRCKAKIMLMQSLFVSAADCKKKPKNQNMKFVMRCVSLTPAREYLTLRKNHRDYQSLGFICVEFKLSRVKKCPSGPSAASALHV